MLHCHSIVCAVRLLDTYNFICQFNENKKSDCAGVENNKQATNLDLQNDTRVDKHRQVGEEDIEGNFRERHQRFIVVGTRSTPVRDGRPLYKI